MKLSPTAVAFVTVLSVSPFMISDGESFFRTFGECGSVSYGLVNSFDELFDSIRVANDYLNEFIELDDDEIVGFCQSIFENGISETASTFEIDTATIHLFLEKIEQSIFGLVNEIKISVIGNTAWSELTVGQIDSLVLSLANATIANRMAPEDLATFGDPFFECAATAYSHVMWQMYLLKEKLDIGPFGGLSEAKHLALIKYYFFSAMRQIIKNFILCIAT